MNAWTAAATALLCAAAPAGWSAATGPVRRRIAAQNLTSTLISLFVLLLAQSSARPAYTDSALVLAVLGPAGTLLYARLLADELASDPPLRRPRELSAASYAVVPLVVIPVCVAAGPGRQMAKLLVIGALLVAGSWVTLRVATSAGTPGGTRREGSHG